MMQIYKRHGVAFNYPAARLLFPGAAYVCDNKVYADQRVLKKPADLVEQLNIFGVDNTCYIAVGTA